MTDKKPEKKVVIEVRKLEKLEPTSTIHDGRGRSPGLKDK